MQISVDPAGKEIGFKLARLNYASAHVTVKAGAPAIKLVVDGNIYAPRDRTQDSDALERLIWVFPPGWSDAFPGELRFMLDSDAADAVCLARVSGMAGLKRSRDPVWPDAMAMADCENHRAPFPADVVRQVGALAETQFNADSMWDEAMVAQFIADLKRVRLLTRRLGYAGPLARYLGYLKRMEMAVQFATRHFPDVNTTALRAERYHAIATDPDEMMTIIHHLYVLRAAGVAGDFAEYGCFKGFSTSCLSRACAELSMPMHVFDSFEGLPPSNSGRYLPGEYCGSFEDVSRHVGDFGVTEAVRWHRGFFAQTLQSFKAPLACIWMDVDLAESARDVMGRLDLLDARGCVFSHELSAEAFIDGRPNAPALAAGRFEVLSPILDAVQAQAGDISGEHLGNFLGVVYLPASIQALSTSHIRTLLALVD